VPIEVLTDLIRGGQSAFTPSGNPVLSQEASPPASDAGTVRLFARSEGERLFPAYVDPRGRFSSLQPLIARRRVAWANPVGNSTTLHVMGVTLTATGTATAASVATTNIHTVMRRLEYAVTTASTTAVAGYRSGANVFHIGGSGAPHGGFFLVLRFGPSRGQAANATRRGFVGLTSNTAAPTDADPSAGTTWANMVGVGHDAADTNWQIMHRNATGAVTKVDTGITKSYNDFTEMFELVVFAAPAETPFVSIQFTRLSDGTTFARNVTTNLPAPTTLLGFQAYNSVGGTNSVIGIALASLYIETNY